ncbi:dCMP deaminase [Escherichia phage vB_EcoM_RZ]|uniref:Deoxycytidylate deaminase n=1 Tax=Escherichia phage vB_EcoM_RZ TaxID=2893954 RepID=A0AAE9C8E4_9CAUD|nr:dCMP deaminase [Escherichia phage vB_EcoM_RZ]UGL60066.1 deoxycytidylate deaminase [Escherichia phage vB_EcoM_RZ]
MKPTTVLQIAYLVSQESKCCSWKVGAVIEKNGRIISTGYNGSPAGGVNCCEHAEEQGWLLNKPKPVLIPGHKPECVRFSQVDRFVLAKAHREEHSAWSKNNEIHAELNAILFAARMGSSIEGATMYVTLSPCPDCAKAISQSGIKKLVYCETYDKNIPGWDDILKNAGIEVFNVPKRSLDKLNWENINEFCGE